MCSYYELLVRVNKQFYLPDKITCYSVIYEDTRSKIIIFEKFSNESSAVVKMYRVSSEYEKIFINKQCEFSQLLYSNGICTPFRYTSKKEYCIELKYMDLLWNFTVEEYIELLPCYFDLQTFNDYGTLLARIHLITEGYRFRIGRSAIWYNAAESKNEIIRLNKYIAMSHCFEGTKFASISNCIYKCATDLIDKSKALLERLPCYAVQGDCAPNNIIRNERLGILDFDKSGDCCLVSDLVLQCTYIAAKISSENRINKNNIINKTISDYLALRRAGTLEQELMGYLFKLSQAFYYSLIDELKQLLNNKNDNSERIETTLLKILSCLIK